MKNEAQALCFKSRKIVWQSYIVFFNKTGTFWLKMKPTLYVFLAWMAW
jgi:hypothetical protein